MSLVSPEERHVIGYKGSGNLVPSRDDLGKEDVIAWGAFWASCWRQYRHIGPDLNLMEHPSAGRFKQNN